jgi:hypothetical protein
VGWGGCGFFGSGWWDSSRGNYFIDTHIQTLTLAHASTYIYTNTHTHSEIFLKRLSKVSTKVVMLEKGGHYPLEKEAIDQLHGAIYSFIQDTVLKGAGK